MKRRITKRVVDGLDPEPGKRVRVYDDQLVGFGVTVLPTGRKSFFVEYGPEARRRRMTLGTYGALTVEAARKLAQAELGKVSEGGDPLDDKKTRREIPSVRTWVDEYLEGVRRRKKQPRHDERYLGMVKETWGSRRLDQLTRRDVELEFADQAERGHTTANRWLASLRSCLEAARRAEFVDENVAVDIKAFREAPPRSRVLSNDEFARVMKEIDALDDPMERGALLLLIHTGARKSEVLRARWEDFDLEGALWRIPSPKADRPQVVPLTDETIALLRVLPRTGPWLLPGRRDGKPREDVRGAWDDVRERASVKDVTIHDLRRTFGLHVARHAGLHVASKLLRHADIRVTERVYAPLGVEDLREGLAKVAKAREESSRGGAK